MAHDVDPKGLDAALHAHFTAAGDDVSQMEAAISAYLTATQPAGEAEAGIVGRLHKRADQLGMLLSDPPKPHPDAVLIREAAAALTAALRERDGWQRMVAEIVGALPIGRVIPAAGTVRDLVAEINKAFSRAGAAESKLAALQRDLDQARARTWDWPSDPRTDNLKNQLAAAKRELDQARKALEPFALVAEHDIGSGEADTDRFRPMSAHNRAPPLTIADFRRARTVLQENGK